jgi:hypothetical protein
MKYLRVNKWQLIIYFAVLILIADSGCNDTGNNDTKDKDSLKQNTLAALPPNAQDSALPFTMDFEEMNYPGGDTLPHLQSYSFAVSQQGLLLIVGGRRQGLHTFKPMPATNFIQDSSNNFIYVIDPQAGTYKSFNVNLLDTVLSASLQSTNQQYYHDRNSDLLYLIGGYGWNASNTNMRTFNTIISVKVEDLVQAINTGESASQIQALFNVAQDNRFAVTGGDVFKLNNVFYLVFGQRFDGQYRAFGGNDFSQKYTEEVRAFTLLPNSLKINSYGATTNTTADHPFHRRDGNIVNDIDPATGKERITSFGGVFKPGIIGPYTYPVYISNPSTPVVDTNGQQKFSQYSCPVISVYDSAVTRTVYHTFFGGIGHYYYAQTDSQKIVYNIATQQGRNDGFPFVEDITTFQQSADNVYKEFIHVNPIPGNRLLGGSIPFLPNLNLISQGYAYDNSVIKLNALPSNTRVLAGYIFGGIEAQNPLPFIPNTGTFVSNSVFAVYITNTPSAAIPASYGHESVKQDSSLHRK